MLALGCGWLWQQGENEEVLERKGQETYLTESITLFLQTLQEGKHETLPISQPYLETLNKFWNFEVKKKRRKNILIMITNKKTCWFFYQMHAGIHSIHR